MEVKYFGLISEVIGNIGLSGGGRSASNAGIALAILTLVFGLLEGAVSYCKSRGETSVAEKSQIESGIP
jgi:hypothetical protein